MDKFKINIFYKIKETAIILIIFVKRLKHQKYYYNINNTNLKMKTDISTKKSTLLFIY